MSIAQHAERILAAWNMADPEQFESELESALDCCHKRPSRNIFYREQQELLESVVERLRSKSVLDGNTRKASAQSLSAGFALLQHLSHRSVA